MATGNTRPSSFAAADTRKTNRRAAPDHSLIRRLCADIPKTVGAYPCLVAGPRAAFQYFFSLPAILWSVSWSDSKIAQEIANIINLMR
jgi:hypothetical protein